MNYELPWAIVCSVMPTKRCRHKDATFVRRRIYSIRSFYLKQNREMPFCFLFFIENTKNKGKVQINFSLLLLDSKLQTEYYEKCKLETFSKISNSYQNLRWTNMKITVDRSNFYKVTFKLIWSNRWVSIFFIFREMHFTICLKDR